MSRVLLVALAAAGLGGCVANIEGKAAQQCAPLAQNGAIYSDCIGAAQARLAAKNRRTARILAAGLGGAVSPSRQDTAGSAGLFLKRSYISGFNKICIYSGIRGEEAVTIGSAELCPLAR